MARKFTIAQLATRARERADMVNSGFITPSELRGYLSASYAELYERLIQSGLFYFDWQTQTINGDGNELYDLPDDYYATLRMDYEWSSNYHTELWEYMFQERTRFENAIGGATSGYSTHYTISGSKVSLLPAPTGGTYRHFYAPRPMDLGSEEYSDDTEIDGVGGWEEWIIVDAARKMLAKEESTTAHLERDLQRLEARIEEMAQNRAWASPRRVVDVNDRKQETTGWWKYARGAD
jgi:hypothetical protein